MTEQKTKNYKDELQTGDLVSFGRYVPDGIPARTEPVIWRVIDVCDRNALLLSDSGLDAMKYTDSPVHPSSTRDYNRICKERERTGKSFDVLMEEAVKLDAEQRKEYVHWEDSSVRKWLNDDFYNSCFSKDEQDSIVVTNLKTDSGNEIEDRIFLLTSDEVEKYFPQYKDRLLRLSKFMLEKREDKITLPDGGFTSLSTFSTSEGYGDWWLRSGGEHGAHYVSCLGGNINCGMEKCDFGFLRPVLWLKLSV